MCLDKRVFKLACYLEYCQETDRYFKYKFSYHGCFFVMLYQQKALKNTLRISNSVVYLRSLLYNGSNF